MESIIQVKNISKKYNINQQRGGYVALRDVLANVIKKPFSYAKHKAMEITGKAGREEFWALKDINFSVEKGEALGIIGANGAGKSTLLKILTQITPPTTGEITMEGKVASLLEVGTGFHPELTGRENIFLNGAILGMRKEEIEKKFDEIVEFSGIGKFIDTPVKHYSSGMYVRLAFSVAAHLEPDILLIDEVLAVGDANFQKKCLGKMDEETKKSGRTILFVSHNMTAIQNLCERCILLKNGKIDMIGKTNEVVKTYLKIISTNTITPLNNRKDRTGKGNIKFTEIKFLGINNNNSNIYAIGDDIYIYLKIKNSYTKDVQIKLYLNIRTTTGQELISCDSALKAKTYTLPKFSETTVMCKIYSPMLNFGYYHINLGVSYNDQMEDRIQSASEFSIKTGNFDNRITTNQFPVLAKFEWDFKKCL